MEKWLFLQGKKNTILKTPVKTILLIQIRSLKAVTLAFIDRIRNKKRCRECVAKVSLNISLRGYNLFVPGNMKSVILNNESYPHILIICNWYISFSSNQSIPVRKYFNFIFFFFFFHFSTIGEYSKCKIKEILKCNKIILPARNLEWLFIR